MYDLFSCPPCEGEGPDVQGTDTDTAQICKTVLLIMGMKVSVRASLDTYDINNVAVTAFADIGQCARLTSNLCTFKKFLRVREFLM